MVPELLKVVLHVLVFAYLLNLFQEEVELNFRAVDQMPSLQKLDELVQVTHFRVLDASQAVHSLWLHGELSEQSFETVLIL